MNDDTDVISIENVLRCWGVKVQKCSEVVKCYCAKKWWRFRVLGCWSAKISYNLLVQAIYLQKGDGNTWTPRPINTSTPPHVNTSTLQHSQATDSHLRILPPKKPLKTPKARVWNFKIFSAKWDLTSDSYSTFLIGGSSDYRPNPYLWKDQSQYQR